MSRGFFSWYELFDEPAKVELERMIEENVDEILRSSPKLFRYNTRQHLKPFIQLVKRFIFEGAIGLGLAHKLEKMISFSMHKHFNTPFQGNTGQAGPLDLSFLMGRTKEALDHSAGRQKVAYNVMQALHFSLLGEFPGMPRCIFYFNQEMKHSVNYVLQSIRIGMPTDTILAGIESPYPPEDTIDNGIAIQRTIKREIVDAGYGDAPAHPAQQAHQPVELVLPPVYGRHQSNGNLTERPHQDGQQQATPHFLRAMHAPPAPTAPRQRELAQIERQLGGSQAVNALAAAPVPGHQLPNGRLVEQQQAVPIPVPNMSAIQLLMHYAQQRPLEHAMALRALAGAPPHGHQLPNRNLVELPQHRPMPIQLQAQRPAPQPAVQQNNERVPPRVAEVIPGPRAAGIPGPRIVPQPPLQIAAPAAFENIPYPWNTMVPRNPWDWVDPQSEWNRMVRAALGAPQFTWIDYLAEHGLFMPPYPIAFQIQQANAFKAEVFLRKSEERMRRRERREQYRRVPRGHVHHINLD